jgi:hypothetical protein
MEITALGEEYSLQDKMDSALSICKLKGLFKKSVIEINDVGEVPFVREANQALTPCFCWS